MVKCLTLVGLLVVGNVSFGLISDDERIMGRGDANNDAVVDGSDPVYLNAYLFNGGPAPPCMNQADANDDGAVDISDSIYLLSWLYSGGPEPPAPGPFNTECTVDEAPNPGCENPCS